MRTTTPLARLRSDLTKRAEEIAERAAEKATLAPERSAKVAMATVGIHLVVAALLRDQVSNAQLAGYLGVSAFAAVGIVAAARARARRPDSDLLVRSADIAFTALSAAAAGWPAWLTLSGGRYDEFVHIVNAVLWLNVIICAVTPSLRRGLFRFAITAGTATTGWAVQGRPGLSDLVGVSVLLGAACVIAHREAWKRLDGLAALNRHLHRSNASLAITNDQLATLASHDALTGLANRAKLIPELRALLNGTDRTDTGAGVAVLFLDVDRFKAVNDTLGHLAGDALLRTVAERAALTLPGSAILSRLGGDEFTFVLQVSGREEAWQAGEALRRAVSQPIEVEGRSIVVTASIGIAISRPSDEPEDLLRHADAALYSAKEAGRNRTQVFDDRLAASVRRRLEDEQALRAALDAGLIEPWFQPEVDLADGCVVGVEALARYHHAERGTLEAVDFFGLAVESGIVDRLSDTVAERAIANRGEWHRAGLVDEGLLVRVHASPLQVLEHAFVRRLRDQLEQYGCPPEVVMIEVTEKELITDVVRARSALTELRSMGCRVALDDFGRGYSFFNILTQLPLDNVKIDQRLARRSSSDPRARAVVETLLALASQLGITVCADGVETQQEADHLRELGCHTAQGFLWSPALEPMALLSTLGHTGGIVTGPPSSQAGKQTLARGA